ncbi:YozQ family protein [Paenibacillus allorhizosphaerae]|uniref:DUF4025 domain-containing protein n=1 Tax=Paenibacillus allorhizosphaerae TaxID=2849866 RepID=A0ABN7TYI4_9BACL|nr:YozQ family protein [Paenibacillus allorhizosphaerae]CAG7657266.1 hypothetical protein PAECIP111802_06674 [Paenibacillus allorhizosphaerae]
MSGKQASKALKRSYEQVTANRYDISDYKSENETSRGLAETHEQMSDAYVAGTNEANGATKAGEQSSALVIPAYVFDEETQE